MTKGTARPKKKMCLYLCLYLCLCLCECVWHTLEHMNLMTKGTVNDLPKDWSVSVSHICVCVYICNCVYICVCVCQRPVCLYLRLCLCMWDTFSWGACVWCMCSVGLWLYPQGTVPQGTDCAMWDCGHSHTGHRQKMWSVGLWLCPHTQTLCQRPTEPIRFRSLTVPTYTDTHAPNTCT